jgi:hypothetical protein
LAWWGLRRSFQEDVVLIHHVFANKTNVGDWLAALGIQRALTGCSVVEYFCDEPFVDDTLAALSQASADDLVIIGGGGLFMDYFIPFWEGFGRIAEHMSYGIWGVGLCDLKATPSLPAVELLTEVVQKSRFCFVRDDLTRSYLKHCVLPEPIGCPSLLELSPIAQSGQSILHVDNYTTAGADVYETMECLAAEWAKESGRPLLRTNNRIEPDLAALHKTLDRYRSAEIVLSSALHGCIIGAALGRKVIAVSGDRKIDSFMRAAGLEDWICDQTEVNRLPELFRQVAEQPPCERNLDRMRQTNRAVARHVLGLTAGVNSSTMPSSASMLE